MKEPLYKLLQAKLELGSINSAALCYINLAQPIIDNERTNTMRLDTSRPGCIVLRINSSWLDCIHISDLTKLIYIEASRIALQHVTIRDTHTVANLPSSDIICNRFSDGGLMLSGCSFSEAMKVSGISEWYASAKKLYEAETNSSWIVEDETLERNCYWMNRVKEDENEKKNGESKDNSGQSASTEENDESKDNSEQSASTKENDSRNINQKAINDYFSDKDRAKDWSANEGMRERVKDVTRRLDQNGILGTSAWGTGSGGKLEKILAASKPPVDPTMILKMFLGNIRSQKSESTRRKQNRRYGLLFPGTRSLYKSRLLIVSDTSGSMSDYDLGHAVSLIMALARDAEIYFSWWDCSCTEPKRLRSADMIGKAMDVEGRGGTDPTCVFDMLEEKNYTRMFSGIIFFSDMVFGEVDKPKCISNNKMLWISTKDGTEPPDWVPVNRRMKACDMSKAIMKKKGMPI